MLGGNGEGDASSELLFTWPGISSNLSSSTVMTTLGRNGVAAAAGCGKELLQTASVAASELV
jgi:hypothetical protein